MGAIAPIAFQYWLCGACMGLHHRGGNDRDGLMVAIEAFMVGQEADQ